VHSASYKGKSGQREPADWITIAPVAAAISVLEKLSAGQAGGSWRNTLWPVLDIDAPTKTTCRPRSSDSSTSIAIHLNALFGSNEKPVIAPGPTGRAMAYHHPPVSPHYRLAHCNRPFGTIAGMIQYKHASVAAFEGYAGSSRSGFRAESRRSADSARSRISSPISMIIRSAPGSPVPPLRGLGEHSTPPRGASALAR